MKYWWILFIIILCATIAIVAIYVKTPSPQPQSGAILDLLCKKKVTTATNNANRTCTQQKNDLQNTIEECFPKKYCSKTKSCVDLYSDNDNCGACDKPCGENERCDDGKCISNCFPQTYCSKIKSCADLSSDNANCGACYKPCGQNEICNGGKCFSKYLQIKYTGVPANTSVILPIVEIPGKTFQISWGDGSNTAQSEKTHTYSNPGDYIVTILGENVIRELTSENIMRSQNSQGIQYITHILSYGNNFLTEINYAGMKNLVSVPSFLPTNITWAVSMFSGCSNFNQDLSTWDVSNVGVMSFMFENCSKFNQDLSKWNVKKVNDMPGMFAGCTSFNQPLNDWNVSGVSGMSAMFYGCKSFNQPLDKWNVKQVTDMRFMFVNCTSFNQDLSNWNGTYIASRLMDSMFYGTKITLQTIKDWGKNWVGAPNPQELFSDPFP